MSPLPLLTLAMYVNVVRTPGYIALKYYVRILQAVSEEKLMLKITGASLDEKQNDTATACL